MAADGKIAIVAALRREIWPLVKGWPVSRRQSGGREFAFYEKGSCVVVCGGIGSEPARRATEAVIQLYGPSLVVSVGFAGALHPELAVGSVLTPRFVIDSSDGSRVDTGADEGILVTFGSVANVEQKARLAKAYSAEAVDMEAASVARGAAAHGVRFMACKAVSDASETALPLTERFVSHDGEFLLAKFAVHAAIRPWMWNGLVRLARNAALASRNLCEQLRAITQTTTGDGIPEIRKEASESVFSASSALKS